MTRLQLSFVELSEIGNNVCNVCVSGVEEVCQEVSSPLCRVVEDRKCETEYLLSYEQACQEDQQPCQQEEQECRYEDRTVCHTHYETLKVGPCQFVCLLVFLSVCISPIFFQGGSLLHGP